jgi:putative NADH-flavin reductase
MKVVVLGATGGTGTKLLEQCLERGHDVTAVARSPDKLDALCQKQPRLRVVQADVLSADSLAPHVAHADVVISTLGFSLRNKPVTYALEWQCESLND